MLKKYCFLLAVLVVLIGLSFVFGWAAAMAVGALGPQEPGLVMGPHAFELVASLSALKTLITGICIGAVGGVAALALTRAEPRS